MRVSVLVNPRAGAGRARRQLPAIRDGLERLGIEHEIFETLRPQHATSLARAARDSGRELIAVVGGDGTLSEVCQAYIDAAGSPLPGPPIALLSMGTGGDFARGCAFEDSGLAASLARLAAGRVRAVDLGVLTLHDSRGEPLHRAFINVASVGLSGAVDERVERGPKWLGGKAAFLLGTLGAALVYENIPVEVDLDDQPWHRGPILLAAIANGQFMGGGMRIAPDASTADGLLDIVLVGDLGRARFLSLFPRVYKGAHVGLEAVRTGRGRSVAVRALDAARPVLVDVDGETPGYLPLTARIFPGALQLIVD